MCADFSLGFDWRHRLPERRNAYLRIEFGMIGEIDANANCVLLSGGWDSALRRVDFGEQST